MAINLFERGKGFQYLQELYNLDQDDISWIQDNLFDYRSELSTPEQVENLICQMRDQMHESEESLERTRQFLLDRDRLERWVKDDAEELFLKRFSERDYSAVQFTLMHITTAIDDGESIRANGLQKLTTLLETESPLSSFLAEEGIVFDLTREIIKINGDTHSLQEYRFGELHSKLCTFRGEIEAFISGEIERMKNYSGIQDYPEFLWSLDRTLFDDREILREKWCQRRTVRYCIQFDAGIDEFTISSCPDADNRDLNCWTIRACLQNMCKDEITPERYAALTGSIAPQRLRITIL